mgnify:FL=1|jgi:hypothetical protein|tara:strand:- start:1418 stop:2032 length:615 start_codon:yes stop_codon:yes gene_type:complete
MIKLLDILSEIDYHSKLSKAHKPDYEQLGTSEFIPFAETTDEAATPENAPGYFKGLSKKEKEERQRVIAKRSKMDDDDPDAYKAFRTDTGKKTKPSSHTAKFKKMFGESGWKALQEVWEETKTLKEAPADKALKNKAKKTGIPTGILRQVYNRGLAAWKTGHTPGAPQAAWGMARVNSFATKGKGTWGKADKDLASKARKAKKK